MLHTTLRRGTVAVGRRQRTLVPLGRRLGLATSSRADADTRPPSERLTVLCILDGWGYREEEDFNSVLLADTPNFDRMFGKAAMTGAQSFLQASEEAVGLPKGQIGNSEVGHMNLGAGRRILQDLLAIDLAVKEGTLANKQALSEHIAALQRTGGTCHLMGLVSPGGVHAMQAHITSLANTVNAAGVPVVIHAFTDGRDVPPQSAVDTMPAFLATLDPGVTVGTVTGRYFAMDRDNRWERVGQAYDVIVQAKGVAQGAPDALAAIQQAYSQDINDEFVPATVIGDYQGVKAGDGILMANFRADRARELLLALVDPSPPEELGIGTERPDRPKVEIATGMVQYSDRHSEYMDAIIGVKDIPKPLGEVVADQGLQQLRIAETEKYPHVTFFFNGGREEPFPHEDRILVPSPKVATYDLQPEMSTPEVTEELCKAIDSGKYNMVILNYASPDMVGHTGSLDAAKITCETVDSALGKLMASVEKQQGTLLVTADHGNCEVMWDYGENCPHTAHTLNKVSIMLHDFSGAGNKYKLRDGALCDVAPTILQLMGVQQPDVMTGTTLIEP